jgi:magnesium-protoporphyrin O-methyltransferase
VTGCCARDYEQVFGDRGAERSARRFRRRGLRGSAKTLAELAGDVRGASVLDVGGGVGGIEIELLEAGAERATSVELAATYERAARTLLAERGLAGRVDRRVGDFVEEADELEPHDVVVMHRVVCCYPDVDALVGSAADRTRGRLLLTYPQETVVAHIVFAALNALQRLRRSTFRGYVHPVDHIVAVARAHGLTPAERRRHGMMWESAAFTSTR